MNKAAPPSPAWRARAELWLWRHGLWLPLLLALLSGTLALLWDMQTQAAPAAAAPMRAVTPSDDATRLEAFRQTLPPAEQATAVVRRLVTLTQPGLAWQRAEFQHTDDAAPGVLRLQITVPVAGEYADMRSALQHALAQMPELSLDQVLLRRVQAAGSQLESRLRFSLWLSTLPRRAP